MFILFLHLKSELLTLQKRICSYLLAGWPFTRLPLGEILQAIRLALYSLDDERPFLLKIGLRQ